MDIAHIFSHTAQAAEAVHEAAEAANPNVATMFGISAKLFVAQLVNFGIVLLVLWKWVFTPVTKALQKRTQKIEQSLQTAENIQVQKAEFETWKKAEMAQARVAAAEIVGQAKGEAEKVREELLHKAKQEQEKLLADGKKALAQEQEQVLAEARGQLADLVVLAAEKVLKEKLTDKKDKELAQSALNTLSTKH